MLLPKKRQLGTTCHHTKNNEVTGNKVTFNITDTATGRKVIQTNESNNEYTEVNLNNGIMTVTTGEKIGGKYVSKKSNVCNLEEETDKVVIEENNTSEFSSQKQVKTLILASGPLTYS